MIPDAGSDVGGFDLQLAAIPRIAHQGQRISEETRNTVLELEEIHDLGRDATLLAFWGLRAGIEFLVDFEPHHDGEVDVLATDTSAHDWDLDALVHIKIQIRDLKLVSNSIELGPTFVVG